MKGQFFFRPDGPCRTPAQPILYCDIESECLERYRPGGYHPVNVGDTVSVGEFKYSKDLLRFRQNNMMVSAIRASLLTPFSTMAPMADIDARPGSQITESFPRRIVEPATFPISDVAGQVHATLIDFEQAFLRTDQSLAHVPYPVDFQSSRDAAGIDMGPAD
ncbi:hypothetical protein PV08_06052 [Exophiala spinifera]|uniref:Uncharacterized protein n=1 Tax=Exophiala spinifera TaxID=91928 RepID=A0A0D1YLZ0_9EURO|nr:uncharacterized protein PV08_06052 [Exophiala spinifera]KIW16001.1 hypothetical protein PV08_06052 [Exophiala spinifera]